MSKQNTGSRTAVEIRMAAVLGMDAETRVAFESLERLATQGAVAIPGTFMPDAGVSARLHRWGVIEHATEEDFRRVKTVALPFGGIAARDRRRWKEEGWRIVDTRSAHVRRAQVTLGLLKLEGAQTLVIGRHDDPETLALTADYPGTIILEDTTDIARLHYAPAFGAVCQTTLSPRRVAWLSQQLKMRYRDARFSFLETLSPGMAARERALETLCDWCDGVLVAGDPGEASVEALLETARRCGKPAAGEDDTHALAGCRRIALTAGAFVLPERLGEVANPLTESLHR
ncbi:MAG: hypothetical protein QM755_01030 [Luteolibacter sp.]